MYLVRKIVRLVTSAIGTPLAYELHSLIKQGKDDLAVALVPNHPDSYSRASSYLDDAQVSALVRKLPGLNTGVDLVAKAKLTYHSCEKRNRETNNRLASVINWFDRGFHGDETDLRLFLLLKDMRKLVSDSLGPLPGYLVPRFSGGSTFFDKGDKITIPHKMGSHPACTPRAWAVVNQFYGETLWGKSKLENYEPEFVRGNRFTTVPKDSTKNRGICIEPSLNIAFQLYVGQHIRRRYALASGVVIDGLGRRNAQYVHRLKAAVASVTGRDATIDLSNASDLVSYNLVKLLLPRGWFNLLDDLRSPETLIDGQWCKNQKFSSMGNGFTFELESLLFWAIAKTVCGQASAYGDDIIVPTSSAGALISALEYLGLEINTSKSFVDPLGSFRESCGGDYFDGNPVRPVYLTVNPDNPIEWIVLHNQLTRLLKRGWNDSLIARAQQICVNAVPVKYRLFGPHGLDTVFGTDDRTRYRVRQATDENGPRGFHELMVVKAIETRVKLKQFTPDVQLASAILGVSSKGPTIRDGISGFKTTWQPTVM